MGDKKKKEKWINDNLAFAEIRQIKLEQLLANEEYESAKQIIAGGIAVAKEKRHPGTVRTWEDQLIHISRLQKDTDTERALLRKSFLEGYRHMEYYRPLKSTYSSVEWLTVRDDLIKELSKKTGQFNHNNFYIIADIYTEDKLWDRLLALLQKETCSLDTLRRLGEPLHKIYPAEMLALYQPAVIKEAQAASSRSHYNDLANELKNLLKIEGGQAVVKVLLDGFRKEFAQRPAMMDELKRVL